VQPVAAAVPDEAELLYAKFQGHPQSSAQAQLSYDEVQLYAKFSGSPASAGH
jgi:hypothetical protein